MPFRALSALRRWLESLEPGSRILVYRGFIGAAVGAALGATNRLSVVHLGSPGWVFNSVTLLVLYLATLPLAMRISRRRFDVLGKGASVYLATALIAYILITS